jgi:hypothetical protein
MSDAIPVRPLLTITAEMAELDRLIAENDGEMTAEVEARFDALGFDFGAKVDAYMARRAGLLVSAATCKAEADAVQAEADRLKARAKRCEAAVKDMETRLAIAMQQRKLTEFERGRFRIKATPVPGAVTTTAPAPLFKGEYTALPEDLRACVRVIPPMAGGYEWDKNALKALHKTNPDAVKAVATIAETIRVTIS